MTKTNKQLREERLSERKELADKLRETEEQIQKLGDDVNAVQKDAQKKVTALQRQAPPLIGYAQALREILDIAGPKDPARPLNK